jgi:hypothetical protein
VAIALTKPDIRLGRSRDPIQEHDKIEAEFRAKKARGEARLAGLDAQWAAVQWQSTLSPAEIDKQIAQLDRDRAAARLEIASATEALTLADQRRHFAQRASSELVFAEVAAERKTLHAATVLEADKLEPLVTELNLVNARIRANARHDRELQHRQIIAIREGGLVGRDVAASIQEGDGVWLLNGVQADLDATSLDLKNAGQYR